MRFFGQKLKVSALVLGLVLVGGIGCGIVEYPGQPGVVTNSYSKIDLEDIGPEGLWAYEVAYDNRTGGPGVAAIVTKLYPKAKTYTSNARSNADGTFYKVKTEYAGATVQMISLPKLNQVMMPPNSQVFFWIGYSESLDEIDDRNLAEEKIFGKGLKLSQKALAKARQKFQLLRAGTLTGDGMLSYEVSKIMLDNVAYELPQAVIVETNVLQNGIRTNISAETKKAFRQFLENTFPKGFKGTLKAMVKGVENPIEFGVRIHSETTARAAGIGVIHKSQSELQQLAAQMASR